jgi:methyl-accepting chemotaxis protein
MKKMNLSISLKLAVPLVSILVVLVITILFAMNSSLKKTYQNNGLKELRKTEKQMFTGLNAIMNNCVDDSSRKSGIKEIIDKNDGNVKVIPSKEIFGGNIAEDETELAVKSDKKNRIVYKNDAIIGYTPWLVKEECTGCHKYPVGTLLGIVVNKVSQVENNQELRKMQLFFSSLFLGVLVILAFTFYGLITFFLKKPLKKIKEEEIDQIIGRNLSFPLPELSNDELGEIGRSLYDMKESQRDVIRRINIVASEVQKAAAYLKTASAEITDGVGKAASEISSVATAGEQMSATSGDIAQNCHFAAQASQTAVKTALGGGEILKETITSMNQIAASVSDTAETVKSLGRRSDQIGEIVGTIEDIADQTNLLALNAAIEAARAGEQGRGFAVVADEVRALADRTTKATHEISEMIKVIQKETQAAVKAMEQGVIIVKAGTEKAENSGSALEEIINQVSGVNDQINQIATAAEEQTATTREISGNMHRIDKFIEEVSKGNEENLVAIIQLQAVIKELHTHVEIFTI